MAPAPQLRALGKGGPKVPAMGFGMMGLSAAYISKPDPDEERFATLDAAYQLGCTPFDSADIYGDSEDLLGKWFKRSGKRSEVDTVTSKHAVVGSADCRQIFLATKFANVLENGQRMIRNEPEYVRAACDKSLKRLGVDQIDLYYCHRFNGEVPVEKIVGAMKELVE